MRLIATSRSSPVRTSRIRLDAPFFPLRCPVTGSNRKLHSLVLRPGSRSKQLQFACNGTRCSHAIGPARLSASGLNRSCSSVMYQWADGLLGHNVTNQARRCSPASRSLAMGSRIEGPDWKGALMILAAIGLFVLVPAMCAYVEIP